MLIKNPKVTKILIFNSEFFKVLPVSFETPPVLQPNSRVSQLAVIAFTYIQFLLSQGKMKFHSIITAVFLVLTCAYTNLAIDTKPELKNNVLNFGYGVNFKYEGMLSHSFDRFYVVTNSEIPKIKDLKLMTLTFDLKCEHLNNPKSYIHWYLKHCQKIAHYVRFY